MKICFLAAASSIHTIKWVNAMVRRGHNVHLITMHRPDKDKIDDRVKVYLLPIKHSIGYYLNVFKVNRLLKEIKPNILNTHYASGYGTLSRLVHFKPTILSVWGSDVYLFPYKSTFNKKTLIKNLKAATRVASTSHDMKAQTEKFIKPSLPISVTPFGVDLNKFRPNKELRDPSVITIGIIKTLEENYGVNYLLESVCQLIKRLEKSNQSELASKIRLLIVGAGSQYNTLIELSKRLKINQITKFIGAVSHEEVPDYLNKLDIYCAPSISESFGVAIIEASACGIPVIVSDVGGLPEVVINNKTGYVVQNKNVNHITEKLYDLVMNEGKRIEMGKNGREYITSNYSWKHSVKIMENLYEEVNNKNENYR